MQTMSEPNYKALIVLYNKNFDESSTLLSLLNCYNKNIELTIFNNGPKLLTETNVILDSLKSAFKGVNVIQNINNIPLSIIYNGFCSNTNICSIYYAIFDDDTNIPPDYFNLNQDCYDIIFPLVKTSDGNIRYPKRDGLVLKNLGVYDNNQFIYTSGSGIILHASLVDKILHFYDELFDTDYALYGVDVSLFRKISHLHSKNTKVKMLVQGVIVHGLSLYDEKLTPFRRKERLIDNVITLRKYPKSFMHSLFFFTKMLMKRVLLIQFDDIKLMFTTLRDGCHPKCKK